MFSNRNQYDNFMKNNCYKCPLYVHYEEVNEDNTVCEIEERIALSPNLDKKEAIDIFPYEWLSEDISICKKRLEN